VRLAALCIWLAIDEELDDQTTLNYWDKTNSEILYLGQCLSRLAKAVGCSKVTLYEVLATEQ
jgi:hypothetical protein